MNCSQCNSINCIKKGLRNNFQRFYCKDCQSYFQEKYVYYAYKPDTNDFIKNLLKEGCSVRGIARVLIVDLCTPTSLEISC